MRPASVAGPSRDEPALTDRQATAIVHSRGRVADVGHHRERFARARKSDPRSFHERRVRRARRRRARVGLLRPRRRHVRRRAGCVHRRRARRAARRACRRGVRAGQQRARVPHARWSSTSTRPPHRSTGSRCSARPGSFDFAIPDEVVDLAAANGLRVRGHPLVWGRLGLPAYVRDEDSPEDMRAMLRAHLTTILERYRGRIVQYDAVNEPITFLGADEGTDGLDGNVFYRVLGPTWVREVLDLVHADRSRRRAVRERLRRDVARAEAGALLRADPRAGRERRADPRRRLPGPHPPAVPARLDPTEQETADAIRRFAALGLRVEITEIDVTIDPTVARCARGSSRDVPEPRARLLHDARLRRDHDVGRDRQVHLDPRLLRGRRCAAAVRRGVRAEAGVLRGARRARGAGALTRSLTRRAGCARTGRRSARSRDRSSRASHRARRRWPRARRRSPGGPSPDRP